MGSICTYTFRHQQRVGSHTIYYFGRGLYEPLTNRYVPLFRAKASRPWLPHSPPLTTTTLPIIIITTTMESTVRTIIIMPIGHRGRRNNNDARRATLGISTAIYAYARTTCIKGTTTIWNTTKGIGSQPASCIATIVACCRSMFGVHDARGPANADTLCSSNAAWM